MTVADHNWSILYGIRTYLLTENGHIFDLKFFAAAPEGLRNGTFATTSNHQKNPGQVEMLNLTIVKRL